jgi:hypothetical protein
MHMPDLFLARAAECEAMAKVASEPDSKAVWARMAERWHRCAEVEKREQALAVQREPMRHRH